MKPKNTHGGARKGAGRKLLGDVPMTRHQVMLDDETVTKARAIGGGNLSAGIRAKFASVGTKTRARPLKAKP